jgi:hypothetical protein
MYCCCLGMSTPRHSEILQSLHFGFKKSKQTQEYEDEETAMLQHTGNHSPNEPIYLFIYYYYYYFNPMLPHVPYGLHGLPPGCGRNVADF